MGKSHKHQVVLQKWKNHMSIENFHIHEKKFYRYGKVPEPYGTVSEASKKFISMEKAHRHGIFL